MPDLTTDELSQLARSATRARPDVVTVDSADLSRLVLMASRGARLRPKGILGATVALDDLRQALDEIRGIDPAWLPGRGPTLAKSLSNILELLGRSIDQIAVYLGGPERG